MNLNYILNNDVNRIFHNDILFGLLGNKSPVTHYDANGEMLSPDAYNKSLEDFSALVKAEHKNLVFTKQKSLAELYFHQIGNNVDALFHLDVINLVLGSMKASMYLGSFSFVTFFTGLSFIYNSDNLQAAISNYDARNYNHNGIKLYSPVSHFKNNEGKIKDSAQFHKEWEAMKLSLQEYHEEMFEYEYSSNLKAALVYTGKIFTDISNFSLLKAFGDAMIAVGCLVRAPIDTSFGAVYTALKVNSAFQTAVHNKSNAISNSVKSAIKYGEDFVKAGVYAVGGAIGSVAYDASAWAIGGIASGAKAGVYAVGSAVGSVAYDASTWAAEGIASGAKTAAHTVGNKASEFGSWAYDTATPFAESAMNSAYAVSNKASEYASWSYNELALLGHNSYNFIPVLALYSFIPALALFSLEEAVLI